MQPNEPRVEWALADLTAALAAAANRDQILDAALRYAGKFFQASALFVAMGDQAVIHGTLGLNLPEGAGRFSSDLGRPSFLQRAAQARRFYLGVVPADDESFGLLARMGRKLPRSIFVLPILIKKRVVALVYGDNDFHQLKIDHVKDLLPMAEEVTWAFERLLISRKGSEYGPGGGSTGQGGDEGPAAGGGGNSGKLASSAVLSPKLEAPERILTSGWSEPADEPRPSEKLAPAPGLAPRSERESGNVPSATGGSADDGAAPSAPASQEGDLDARALGDALTGSVGWGEPAEVSAPDDTWTGPPGSPLVSRSGSRGGPPSSATGGGPGMELIDDAHDEDSWNPPPLGGAAATRSFSERAATLQRRAMAAAGAPVPAVAPAVPAPKQAAMPGPAEQPSGRTTQLLFGPPDLGTADSIAEAIIAHTDDDLLGPPEGGDDAGELPIVTPSRQRTVEAEVDALASATIMRGGREHDRGDLTLEGPDLFTLIQMVDGAGAATTEASEKERAIERLVQIGEPALRWLIERFPGKTHLDRLAFDVDELPGVEECGDLLKAVVRFGYASVPYLMPLLIRNNVDVRFYATYAFTALPYPEAIKGLLPRLFDTDYRVRRAAIRALRGLTSAEEFDRVHEQLLRELRGTHVSRQRNAADAAAAFGFAGAVPALVDVLETGDPPAATAARQALFDLTRKDFGDSPRRWRAWWEKNHDRDRREWLFEALGDKTRSIREAAIRDLQRVTGHTFGFDPGEGRRVRDAAMKRWRDYLDEIARERSTS